RRSSPSISAWRPAPARSAPRLRHPEGLSRPRGIGHSAFLSDSRIVGEQAHVRLNDAINIEDLHRMAKARLPKVAFDFIEGGGDDERGLDRNTEAFRKHHLLTHSVIEGW